MGRMIRAELFQKKAVEEDCEKILAGIKRVGEERVSVKCLEKLVEIRKGMYPDNVNDLIHAGAFVRMKDEGGWRDKAGCDGAVASEKGSARRRICRNNEVVMRLKEF